MTKNYSDLFQLLRCHSTPGDEDEVRRFLLKKWREANLSTASWGSYAISAAGSNPSPNKPTLLVCAHMDSPGYTVDKMVHDKLSLIKLGSPTFSQKKVDAVLKTQKRKIPIIVEKQLDKDHHEHYFTHCDASVQFGDRVCFKPNPKINESGDILSPFLDNRLGCYILSRLAEQDLFNESLPVNVVLGATALEEVGSFGAPVVASAIKPDFVVCLDATYEDPLQNVISGQGPVLTLSDASVILSCAFRDTMINLFDNYEIPLQTEVYNYSGTDAKAFPLSGLTCPVAALLIATTGNHSPQETACLNDIEQTIKSIEIFMDNINRLTETF